MKVKGLISARVMRALPFQPTVVPLSVLIDATDSWHEVELVLAFMSGVSVEELDLDKEIVMCDGVRCFFAWQQEAELWAARTEPEVTRKMKIQRTA